MIQMITHFMLLFTYSISSKIWQCVRIYQPERQVTSRYSNSVRLKDGNASCFGIHEQLPKPTSRRAAHANLNKPCARAAPAINNYT